jgi:chemotaxis protein CheX
MTEEDLKVFIKGAQRFFSEVTPRPVKVSTPYVRKPEDHFLYDYSAVIGVSGSQRGMVYFSAPHPMVVELIANLGVKGEDEEACADYVGEIANTIAGNARAHFDSSFMISVPVVFSGITAEQKVHFPRGAPVFVIPLEWNNHQASLVISLRDNSLSNTAAAELDLKSLADDEVVEA